MADQPRRTRSGALTALTVLVLSLSAAADRAGATTPADRYAGLQAETDASVYYADGLRPDGALGEATLRNTLDEPVYLPGCSPFALQKETGPGQWETSGPAMVCVWEGYAQRLDPGALVTFPFQPPGGTGTWRVSFAVSAGCQDGKPLSQAACSATGHVATPPFAIHASRPAGEPAAEPPMEHDTDRPGSDYASLDLLEADPTACQAACFHSPGCAAWTYVKPGVQGPGARCWLKSQVPPAVARDCCVSGVNPAVAGDPQEDARKACEANGGRWGPGGLFPEPLCFYPQRDAGKPCDRDGQCTGHCLLVDPAARIDGMPGQCSAVEPMFGCFEFLDEQGRRQGICID